METARGQGIGPMRPMGPMSMVRGELLVLLADACIPPLYVRDRTKRGGISGSLARSVLLVLAAYEGRAISRSCIADRCGVSVHTVSICLQALVKFGYVIRTEGMGPNDGYRYYILAERLRKAEARVPLVRRTGPTIRYTDERHARDRQRQARKRAEEQRRAQARRTGRQIGHA